MEQSLRQEYSHDVVCPSAIKCEAELEPDDDEARTVSGWRIVMQPRLYSGVSQRRKKAMGKANTGTGPR